MGKGLVLPRFIAGDPGDETSSKNQQCDMEGSQKNFTCYPIGLVPGPTSVPSQVLAAYNTDYASADLEDVFFTQYAEVQSKLGKLLQTNDETPIIMLGEGMLALWAGLKSCVGKGDRVLAISNGNASCSFTFPQSDVNPRNLWKWCG